MKRAILTMYCGKYHSIGVTYADGTQAIYQHDDSDELQKLWEDISDIFPCESHCIINPHLRWYDDSDWFIMVLETIEADE